MRVAFRSPCGADIVVFDAAGSEVLEATALDGLAHAVLPARREVVFVSLRVIAAFLGTLGHLPAAMREANGLGAAFYRLWLLACLRVMRPLAVTTFVDNSMAYQFCSRRMPGVAFIAVQNGARYRYDVTEWLPARYRISMPELLCYGEYERDLYRRHGHDVDTFTPAGSVRAGYYRTVVAPVAPAKCYDVCLVSQWRPDEEYADFPEIGDGVRAADAFLGRYIAEHPGLRVCVAMRGASETETSHYRALLGEGVACIANDMASWSSYRAMDESSVAVTFCSSAVTEAFGWGAKVLSVNASGHDNYDFPVLGPWALGECSYDEFAVALDALRAMTDDEYRACSAEARRYVMAFDPECPAHALLRDRLLGAVAEGGRG